MTDITTRLNAAEERLAAAGRDVAALVMEHIVAMTVKAFPTAHILEVEGQYGDSGFVVRAQRVVGSDRSTIAGYADDWHTEEWDDFTDEVDQYLDQLGDLNPSAWRDSSDIVLQSPDDNDVHVANVVR